MVLSFIEKGITLSHVLTLKIPHPLLNRLEGVCQMAGKSKGATVREAIELLLEKISHQGGELLRIKGITECLFAGKTTKARVDWGQLRQKASGGPGLISPEEEVLQSRRRRL
jgi:hypothetical protein